MSTPKISLIPRLTALLALLAACAFPTFFRLAETPVFGDEALYIRVAMSTAHTGDWAPLLGRPKSFVEKPPLFIWASAAGIRLLGRNELGARLGVGLAALALCAATAFLGLRIGGAWMMAIAPLLLISAPGLLLDHGLRSMVPEALLLLAVTASFLFYVETRGKSLRLRLGGLALLSLFGGWTKGILGPIVVGSTLFLAELATPPAGESGALRENGGSPGETSQRRGRLGRAGATALAAALPGILLYLGWLLFSLESVGGVLRFLHTDLVVRSETGLDPLHLQPPSSYLLAAWQNFGVLALLAPLALVAFFVRERRQRGPEADSRGTASLLLLLWIAVVYLLFAIPASRLPWYVYPAYPALALAAALTLDEVRRFLGRHRGGQVLFLLLLALVFAARVEALVRAWPPREPHSFAALQHRLDGDPTARAYVEPGLVHGVDVVAGIPQWHRLYLLRFVALVQRELPSDAPECSFVVSAKPEAWRPLTGERLAGVTPVPGTRAGELPLFVLDLCRGSFSGGAGESRR